MFSFDEVRTSLDEVSAGAHSSVVDLYEPYGGFGHHFSSNNPDDFLSKLSNSQGTSHDYGFYSLFHDILDCDIPIVEPNSITEDQIEYLGGGATMNVFEGIWEGRLVALKRFSLIPRQNQQASDRRYDNSFRERVRSACREIRLMSHANLRGHPNIVQILAVTWVEKGDSWDNELNPTLIMELADKGVETLENLFRQELISQTDTGFKAFLLSDIIQGLHAIHKHGIVHGDLKPQNVLLFSDNCSRIMAKISDFGFSQETMTDLKAAGGTEYWNAPECFSDCPPEWREYSLKSPRDIYSFGLVAVYILTGKLPFNGDRPINGDISAQMKQKIGQAYVLTETDKAKSLGLPCLDVLDRYTEYSDYILQGDKFQDTGNLVWAVLNPETETRVFGQGFLTVGIILLHNALFRDPKRRFKTWTLSRLLAVDEQGRRKEFDLSPRKLAIIVSKSTAQRKGVGEALMRVPSSMKPALLSRLEAEARGADGNKAAQFFLAWIKLNGLGVPKEMNTSDQFRKMMKEWDPQLAQLVESFILESVIRGKFESSSPFDIQGEIEMLERHLEIVLPEVKETDLLNPIRLTKDSILAACQGESSLEDHRELLRDLFRRYYAEGLKVWVPQRFRPPQFPESSLEAELLSLISLKDSSALESLDRIIANRRPELNKITSEAARAIFFFAAEEGNFKILQKLSHVDLLRKFNSNEALMLATESPCVLYNREPFHALLNSGSLATQWATVNVVRTASVVSRDPEILESLAGLFDGMENLDLIPRNTISRLGDDSRSTNRSVMPGVQYRVNPGFSFSALHSAALADNLTAFRFFLNHGCSPNVRALDERFHLLHTTTGSLQVLFVGVLLSLGQDPNVRTKGLNSGFTPLHILCCNDFVTAFCGYRDSTNITLCQATHFDQETYQLRMEWRDMRYRMAVMELLLHTGADANAQDWDGATPLLNSLQSGELELAKNLIKFPGTDVEVCDFRGESVLHIAVRTKLRYVVDWALSMPQIASLLEAKTSLGATPLWLAARLGLTAIVQLLLDAGAQVNSTNIFDITTLQTAALHGHLEVALLIMEKLMASDEPSNMRRAICQCDVMGRNILHYVADLPISPDPGVTEMHSCLLDLIIGAIQDAGTLINAPDSIGCTPLQVAIAHGNHDIVAKLIELGADEGILSHLGEIDSDTDLIGRIDENVPNTDFWVSVSMHAEMSQSTDVVFSFPQQRLDQNFWCAESVTATVLRALCLREADYWAKGNMIGMEIQERRSRIFSMENASKLYGPDWKSRVHDT